MCKLSYIQVFTVAYILNSDKGLSYITGSKDWPELFDVTIAGSRKPRFYNWTMPFRQINIDKSASFYNTHLYL